MPINGIEVSDVIIFPVRNRKKGDTLQAFARVILNDQFLVSGIKILEGKQGPFVQFPQEHNKASGKIVDICFPITAELRAYISDQVLSQYHLALGIKEKKKKPEKIIVVEIHQGLASKVSGLPKGYAIEVRDYDLDNVSKDDLEIDENGEKYLPHEPLIEFEDK